MLRATTPEHEPLQMEDVPDRSARMTEQHQSEMQLKASAREAAQISTMMADLTRIVEALDSDIASEEQRAKISDPRDVAYPIAARAWWARRENLKTTMSVLASRLDGLTERTGGTLFVDRTLTLSEPLGFGRKVNAG